VSRMTTTRLLRCEKVHMILNILWGEGLGLAVIPGSESIAFMNAIEHFAGLSSESTGLQQHGRKSHLCSAKTIKAPNCGANSHINPVLFKYSSTLA